MFFFQFFYVEVGKQDDDEGVSTLMKYCGIKKTLGCSWIEVHKRVNEGLSTLMKD